MVEISKRFDSLTMPELTIAWEKNMRKQALFERLIGFNVYSGYCRANNYIAGFSHNLYSGYRLLTHKFAALHDDPDTPVSIVSAIGLVLIVTLAILT